jgi:hypothetical protein
MELAGSWQQEKKSRDHTTTLTPSCRGIQSDINNGVPMKQWLKSESGLVMSETSLSLARAWLLAVTSFTCTPQLLETIVND